MKDYPTRIVFHLNGNIRALEWYIFDIKNNVSFHRENDLPSVIEYHINGELDKELWHYNGFVHRENDLPAIIWYGENDRIVSISWLKKGKTHRLYAPAWKTCSGGESWWINDKLITDEVNEFIKEYNLPHYDEWTNDHKVLFKLIFGD